MIPYGRQDIDQHDIDAVLEVLKSDWITQGPNIQQFEQSVIVHCGAKYAVATNSATSALHIACLALGLGEGDYVWTSPITFVASANCALYCGAKVDFVDIELDTYTISIPALEAKLEQAERDGNLPKILIPVHLAGQSSDMAAIKTLSDKYGFKIIEDASHAIGADYKNQPVGNCQYGDICVFSFHPEKIITTAEGGLATTNDPDLAEKMQLFRSHGITRDESLMVGENHGPWYYQQIELGLNYRLTDIQAALGKSQMTRLGGFIDARQDHAAFYNDALSQLPIVLPKQQTDRRSAYHLYVIRLQLDAISKSHRTVFEELRAAGIGVNLHYIPVYLQPFYAKMGFLPESFPNAQRYYAEAISIPMFAKMTQAERNKVVSALTEILV